ncbi:hypothetical protein DRE_03346 [Drechslerella stenobrocha 248]|uniref:Uncharacterized protein n=1 Tax=Drechslerella stenobrocha 248 TaxID=1043628 RepID=W7I465_9PEZI|nr:hypothetical protein DRE_03346 [Drechslerella stenobrocha 248]
MADQGERALAPASDLAAGNKPSDATVPKSSIATPATADGDGSHNLEPTASSSNEIAAAKETNLFPPAKQDGDPSPGPGQPLTDHPPPVLIEKISLADETTPPGGQLHDERYAFPSLHFLFIQA